MASSVCVNTSTGVVLVVLDILFNLPLSLMERDAAFAALDAALSDLLGEPDITSEVWRPQLPRAILEYLYMRPRTEPQPQLDLNGDGLVDLLDAVQAIDNPR